MLPQKSPTSLAGKVASARRGATTARPITWFVRSGGVDMGEAAEPEIALADLVGPVDCSTSQFGAIARDRIYRAKGDARGGVRVWTSARCSWRP